jgi:hypothetical protein
MPAPLAPHLLPPSSNTSVFSGHIFYLHDTFALGPSSAGAAGAPLPARRPFDRSTVAKLIRQYGGRVSPRLTEQTTVFVCSIKSYLEGGEEVRRAEAMGRGRCKVVTWEWIEDSLPGVGRKAARRVATEHYELKKVTRRLGKSLEVKRRKEREYVAELNECKGLVDPGK